jgi:hypothetical protein
MEQGAMEYQKAYLGGGAMQAGAAIGGINVGLAGQLKQEAPKTLASAVSKIESLNARLDKAAESLSMICSQIGALSATNRLGKDGETSASGLVYRMNDTADEAHTRLLTIESYISSLQRALG